MDGVRGAIRREVERIEPFDAQEERTREDVLAWIASGAELCRLRKPAWPDRHLVAYFVLIDGPDLLLVDHIASGLWLPAGGHVEPGEHPRETVLREAKEELSIDGVFLTERPVFLTSTKTVGRGARHTDVSLWYLLEGDRSAAFVHDETELRGVRWFHRDAVPTRRTDPELRRFLAKIGEQA